MCAAVSSRISAIIRAAAPGSVADRLERDVGTTRLGLGSAQQHRGPAFAVLQEVQTAAHARARGPAGTARQGHPGDAAGADAGGVAVRIVGAEQIGETERAVLEADHPDELDRAPDAPTHASSPAWTLTCW